MSDFKKNILVFFPGYKDFHFYKDPGQIAYRFKKVFNFESSILCYKNGEYNETEKFLNVKHLKKKNGLSETVEICLYFIKNAKKINVLILFHIGWLILLIAFVYKIFNPKGFVYLKMDCFFYETEYNWEKKWSEKAIGVRELIKKWMFKNKFVKSVNLWSVEDVESKDYYSQKYFFLKNKLILIHNGHTIDLYNEFKYTDYSNKKNIILSVSNLGTYSKATDILLEAYALIAIKSDWELHLAGKVADEFKPFLESYFKEYPDLKNRIIFHGYLNKIQLFKLYSKSKIFCLPSRFEGFANVFPESMYFENAIITTYDASPRKLIENNCGLLVEKNNIMELSNSMHILIENPNLTRSFGKRAREICEEKLNWDHIVEDIYSYM